MICRELLLGFRHKNFIEYVLHSLGRMAQELPGNSAQGLLYCTKIKNMESQKIVDL